MDGKGRFMDNIFVERLWWTVEHEWVYLRPAAKQKRSLVEFFDWYNRRRPHQATPDEAYFADLRRPWQRRLNPIALGCGEFVDSRLRRYPPDRASAVPYGQARENASAFPPPCPQVGGCPQASQRHRNIKD